MAILRTYTNIKLKEPYHSAMKIRALSVYNSIQLKMLPGNYPSILGSDLGYYVDFSWPGIHHMDAQW